MISIAYHQRVVVRLQNVLLMHMAVDDDFSGNAERGEKKSFYVCFILSFL